MNPRLTPGDTLLHVVRWITNSGRDVKHKYFRRHHDALTFAAKLDRLDKEYAVFTTNTEWTETGS